MDTLTIFDLTILGIIGFTTLIGLLRGFVKETFSIINLVLASIVAIYGEPLLSPIILKKINIPIVAELISNTFLFTTALIIISIAVSNIVKNLNKKIPKSINIPLGLFLGFIKGYLISVLIFVTVFTAFGGKDIDEDEEIGPEWFYSSRSYRPISLGIYIVEPLTDSMFKKLGSTTIPNLNQKNLPNNLKEEDIQKILDTLDKSTIEEDKGYNKNQTKKINQLMETIAN